MFQAIVTTAEMDDENRGDDCVARYTSLGYPVNSGGVPLSCRFMGRTRAGDPVFNYCPTPDAVAFGFIGTPTETIPERYVSEAVSGFKRPREAAFQAEMPPIPSAYPVGLIDSDDVYASDSGEGSTMDSEEEQAAIDEIECERMEEHLRTHYPRDRDFHSDPDVSRDDSQASESGSEGEWSSGSPEESSEDDYDPDARFDQLRVSIRRETLNDIRLRARSGNPAYTEAETSSEGESPSSDSSSDSGYSGDEDTDEESV